MRSVRIALCLWAACALLALSSGDGAARTRRTHKPAPRSHAAHKKAPAKTAARKQPAPPAHAPVLAVKPLPVPALPPSAGTEVTPEDIAEQQQELDRIRDEARRNRALAARLRGREKSV